MQLPGTGELWAKVGDTALRAAGAIQSSAQMLQQSPVNPAVKAQMQAQKASADAGVSQIQAMENLPNQLGRLVMGTDAHGNLIIQAPGTITDPTLANAFQSAFGGIVPGQDDKKRGPVINTGTGSGGDGGGDQGGNQGFEASEYPAGNKPATTTKPTESKKKGPPTTGEMGRNTYYSNVSTALIAGGSYEQTLAGRRAWKSCATCTVILCSEF
jgi:hypothetical protein